MAHDHSHDPHHGHDHHHAHDHAHDHPHEHTHDHDHAHGAGENNYFLDQICSVAVCGALAFVGIMMYTSGMLSWILAPAFWAPVLVGGIALALLVTIRVVTLWREAGEARDAGEHAHAHDHAHAHAHSHDHDHSHDWAPWRYAILILPIVLYFLNLPNQGFSAERLQQMIKGEDIQGGYGLVDSKGQQVETPMFGELNAAALRPEARDYWSGRTALMRGMFYPLEDNNSFTLFRMKMSCCAADAVPMKVRIIAPESLAGKFEMGDWVEAQGQIQFRERVDGGYLPVIVLEEPDDVKETEPAPDQYEI